MAEQPELFPIPQSVPRVTRQMPPPEARLKEPDRRQFIMSCIDLDQLIGETHLARGIHALVEMLPTKGFLGDNKAVEGRAGRPRMSPKMLLAIWLYGYSRGFGEARQIEREMEYEPGLRWLAGNHVVNGRTLAGFRIAHGKALRTVFVELLGILNKEGWIDLSELALDGTKIRANASLSSMRGRQSIEQHIAQAEEVLRDLEQGEKAAMIRDRRAAAKKRAWQQRRERLQAASQELDQVKAAAQAAKREKARVSTTDAEARVMKDGSGGYGLSYNVQVVTETRNKVIVDVAVVQQACDQQEMTPALERLRLADVKAERVLVDGGYTTKEAVETALQQGVDVIGPEIDLEERSRRNCLYALRQAGIAEEFGPQAFTVIEDGQALRCPAGQRLTLQQKSKLYWQYRSRRSDCAACVHQKQCSPKGQRLVKMRRGAELMRAWALRMREPASREAYRQRGPVAEFPHAWIKDKFGLRQFHVRGQEKTQTEAWWVALAYNVRQWFRLSWRPRALAMAESEV